MQEVGAQLRLNPSAFASPEAAAARLAAVTASALAANPGQATALVQLAIGSLVASGSIAAANADTLASAVAAVTASAATAVPDQAAAVAQAAARGVTFARTRDAIEAARAANPRATTGQLTQAALRVLDDAATTAPLSAASTAAFMATLARGPERGGESAASIMAAAVERGALEGIADALRRLGADPITNSALAVAATVATAGELLTVRTTVVAATASSVSTQTFTRGVLSPLTTQSIGGVATAATAPAAAAPDPGGTVLPALDQSQVIVSPSRP